MTLDSKGFVTYSFIILAPLFLSLLFMSCWCFWFLNKKHQLNNICNHHVLKAQEILTHSNNQLMALNAKAWALIIEKRSLDTLILIGAPPAKAAAQARKRIVIFKQNALKKIQKTLIFKANLLAKKEAFQLHKNINRHTKNISHFWSQDFYKAKIQLHWKDSQVKPLFKEIAPPYKYPPSYTKKQEIEAQWSIPLKSLLPGWLNKYIPIHEQWKSHCFSHPNKRSLKWIALTGRAKPLSKL